VFVQIPLIFLERPITRYPGFTYHRECGPAIIRANGTEEWFRHGQLHRVDGPAVVLVGGGRGEWWFEDGPAIIRADSSGQEWWLNGQLHREDGPAVVHADGGQEWWFNGQRHREDGIDSCKWYSKMVVKWSVTPR
jgi:hypothetical protein